MKKFFISLLLFLLFFSSSFAKDYPKLKSPIVSIAGKTPKKLKAPGKINLKDFKVNKPGSLIYLDISERQKELKTFKKISKLCGLETSYAQKIKAGNQILIEPMLEGRGFKWQEGATPITGHNPAEKMVINVNQLNSHWMATGEQVYLDLLKKQILAWAKADAYQVLISDGEAWGGNFGYIDTLEYVRQTIVRMLFGYDLLRQANALTKSEDKIIYDWFERIVAKTSIGEMDGSGKPGDKFPPANHTEASKARVYTMWGVISGNDEYFQAGLKYYLVALKLTRKDGSSPWEIRKQEKKSKRSIRGLEKFTQVVGGMVMIAEIFKNQGYDLYSYETKKGVTVHKMIDFLITYLGYPESGAKKKKYIDPERQQKEKVLKANFGDNSLGWTYAYLKRFPNTEVSKKIIKYYMEPYGYWTRIGWSHGYGINCACAYADLSKIKPSGKGFEYIAIVKNKLDDKVLIKVRTDSKEQAIEEAMKKCTDKYENGCYVHYSSQVAFGG